ncbi:hypothetical protein SAY86_011173 [Trapa natans]|uniref:Uncharacterized protein n=1 Tax=Trapa natans TaxID=22666 RepID=A0AAN7R3Z3_TRANT|nr:hypothetical protein SAY86_011173 [Trapa natans]
MEEFSPPIIIIPKILYMREKASPHLNHSSHTHSDPSTSLSTTSAPRARVSLPSSSTFPPSMRSTPMRPTLIPTTSSMSLGYHRFPSVISPTPFETVQTPLTRDS